MHNAEVPAFIILHSALTLTFPVALERLRAAFSKPLPGVSAHDILAPRPRREWPAGFDRAQVREAAGLLLMFPVGERPHIVLTVRAQTLGRHGGQVSLPGGVIEPGETFEQAALREAHEEIALPLEHVRVLGPLTPLDIPVTGFRLHPIVAETGARPALAPADGEVARILDVPLEDLFEPSRFATADRVLDELSLTIPHFRVGPAAPGTAGGSDEIWGATAMVLAEFLTMLGWKGPSA
jgi:8-oxo-dGTP pyrophosphatase MutT (NUDIX family)